jgi:hypothetical protein
VITDLQLLAKACNAAADHYCADPATAGPAAVIDIYRVLAALAELMAAQQQRQPGERVH